MLVHNAEVTGSLKINNVPFNSGSFSGSFRGDGSQLTGITGASTASYVEYNNVGNKPALVSGSSQITYSGISGVPSGIVSGSSQVTYSGLTGIPAGIVSGSDQITGFGIFATTGSNQFNGSQAVTGSLTVTGQVVAQTLNVQQVTSSIVYSSGSNIFGNTLGNTQQFTGSVSVTGSLTVNGAGTFAGSVATGGNITVTANSAAVRVTESGGADVRMVAGGSSGFFGTYSNHPLIFLTNSTTALTLASTGAATFSSSVGINGSPGTNFPLEAYINSSTAYSSTSRGNVFRVYNSNTGANIFAGIELGGAGSANDGLAGLNAIVTGNGSAALTFYTRDSNTFAEKMRITSGGNVGIGTVSPAGKLEINGLTFVNNTGDSTSRLLLRNSTTGASAGGLDIQEIGVDASLNNASNGYLSLSTNNTERLRITSSGNIGIGTTSPLSKLDISVGNQTSLGLFSASGTSITSAGGSTGNLYQISLGYGGGTYGSSTIAGLTESSTGYNTGALVFATRALTTDSAPIERMRILAAGNMLITAGNATYPASSGASYGLQIFDNTSMAANVGGSLLFQGYKTSTTAVGNFASIVGKKENGTGGNEAGFLGFLTSDSGGTFSEKIRISSDGYLRMATGGIQFNGDTAAANALDDYEEGTWTMSITFGNASVGVTYSNNTGSYTKIGRKVTVIGYMSLTNKGSSTGIAIITGLPFTIASGLSSYSAPTLRCANISYVGMLTGYGAVTQQNIVLQQLTEAGVVGDLTNSNFANNSDVLLSFTYFV